MGMAVFLQKEPKKSQASIDLGQPYPALDSGTEKQPKQKVFGRYIPRTSGWISGQTSRPKNFHPIARRAGKSSFFARMSLTRRRGPEGADVHDPRGSQKNFLRENFGLIFRLLEIA